VGHTRAYATVSDGGLFQFGHSKDYRPDLPQIKVMQAVLDPLGMPLATDVGSGERADDPLYLPCIERVQASMGRHGLLYVGDCKMASRETRARLVGPGDFYLCPLPQVQLAEGELDTALEAVWRGEQSLSPVKREGPTGELEVIAEGYEYAVAMSQQVGEHVQTWTERRLVVRSVRQAHAAEAALRARVAKAIAQIVALNQRGRGKKRFETVAALRQAVVAIVQDYKVENLLWFRLTQHITPRPVRAYRGQPARVDHDRHATVEVCVDEAALEAAVRRLGWRVYGTNQPVESLSLEQAVLAYRNEYQVERSLGRLKGRPLSLTPMYVQRDDHATGLIRLLSIALRVLTLLEFVGRRQLAAEGTKLAGLYAGNPQRETDRPTAERLLEAFQDITPTVSPLLAPVTFRNLMSLQSLPNSIPYRQDNVRRQKDAHHVGTAARGNIERLSRLPQRLPSDGGASGRVRRALSTRAGDRGRPTHYAPLPPGPAVPLAREEC
jgi:transposase